MEDIIDEDSVTSLGQGSIKEQMLHQYSVVRKMASQEFRGGYWEKIQRRHGIVNDKYIPDSREEWMNALACLCSCLKPEFDDIMRESYADIMGRIKKRKKVWREKETELIKRINNRSLSSEYYNRQKFFFFEDMIDLHWELFDAVNAVLFRKGWLQERPYEAES